MNERDFDEISRFLTMVGSATLFDYLKLDAEAPPGEVDRALKERRSWAQGQQANPKYRGEAIWIIKNQRAMREALVESRAAYLERIISRDQEKNLEVLALFIRGTMSSGQLTPAGERAIIAQGQKLGLSDQATRTRIQAIAAEFGLSAGSGPRAEEFQDHYEVLGVRRSATYEEIDQAYRARYRWARTLADTSRSRQEYARLDAALRDLKDPSRRAAYDSVHRSRFPEATDSLDGAQAFLPPPTDDPPSQPSHPSQAEPSVRSVSHHSSRGPHLAAARRDPFELSEPPGTPPPVRSEGSAHPHTTAPSHSAVPAPPPMARPRSSTSEHAHSAPPGARAATAPPGARAATAPPGARAVTAPPGARAVTAPPGGRAPLVDPGSAEVPRPGRVAGRSLDLTSPREGTHLQLQSPAFVPVKTGSRGTTVQIRLQQVGSGTVTGRILADREWVSVEPARLDTGRKEHVIVARIHADRMQRARGSSVVTIVPSHGPRLAITLEVEKRRPFVLVLGLLLGLALVAGLSAVAWHFLGPQPVTLPRVLTVDPNPSSAMVFVDDRLIGPGLQRVDLADFPAGPVELKVSLSGFREHTETIDLPDGQWHVARPRLELERSLSAIPASTEEGLPLDTGQVNEQLAAHRAIFEECYELPGAPPSLRVRAFVSFGGQVDGFLPVEPTDPDPAFVSCVSRGLRAMQFVLKQPADYYTFEATLPAPEAG